MRRVCGVQCNHAPVWSDFAKRVRKLIANVSEEIDNENTYGIVNEKIAV